MTPTLTEKDTAKIDIESTLNVEKLQNSLKENSTDESCEVYSNKGN